MTRGAFFLGFLKGSFRVIRDHMKFEFKFSALFEGHDLKFLKSAKFVEASLSN